MLFLMFQTIIITLHCKLLHNLMFLKCQGFFISFIREGTLFIGGGGGWGFRGEGHQWNFGVMGEVKAFKFLKVRGASCIYFRFRKHKICKIPNAFSAIQGAQISKFPGGACPRPPPPPRLLNACRFMLILSQLEMRSTPRGSPHAHFPLSIPNKSFPIWTRYSENELAR